MSEIYSAPALDERHRNLLNQIAAAVRQQIPSPSQIQSLFNQISPEIKQTLISSMRCEQGTPMHNAAGDGSLEVIKVLLLNGLDINAQRNDGMTPLHLACAFKHFTVVEYLINHTNSHINAVCHGGSTPLMVAIEAGDYHICSFLVERGSDVFLRNKAGYSAMNLATFFNRDEVVLLLLSKSADSIHDSSPFCEVSPLSCLCLRGKIDLLQQLFKQNVDFNHPSYKIRTSPLLSAARGDQLMVVQLLLTHGCDFRATTPEGFTALHLSGSLDVLKLFLDRGCDVGAADYEGNTALHEKMSEGSEEMVHLLLDYGADVNHVNKDGRTALHIAASYDRADILMLLLQRGGDAEVQDDFGDTPMDLLSSDEGKQAVQLFCNWLRRKNLVLCVLGSEIIYGGVSDNVIKNWDLLKEITRFI